MKPDSARNKELIAQFPFLREILDVNLLLEPLDATGGNAKNSLTIKVEKADGDLMWRKADNVGLKGDNAIIFATSDKRQNQAMKKGEHLFAVGKKGVLNRVTWPRNHDEGRGKSVKYANWSLWKTHNEDRGMLSDPIPEEEITHLVWVTIGAWHEDTRKDDSPGSRFGKLIERGMEVTVYTKPDGGFHKLQANSSIGNHLMLDSNTHVRALFEKDDQILNLYGRLDELCTLFQDDVYFSGMRDIFVQGPHRGASGNFGSTKVLCAELCDYERVMLENGSCWISFQLRPNVKIMYVVGMHGTLPQLRALVKNVVRMWTTQPESHSGFRSDEKVSVI